MTKHDKPSAFSRRALLKGAMVVSVGAPLGLDTLLSMNAAQAQGTKPPLMPDQLSSYIAINADGTVSAHRRIRTPCRRPIWRNRFPSAATASMAGS